MLEADGVVGGISRTVERDGWRFDIGGHRFFTKVPRVRRFWHEVLPDDDFLLRPRRSRILYRGRFYDYPLRPLGALRNLGPVEAARCAASYVRARIRPPADQSHLAGWVAARFGERLYRHFFQSYNEKVWGIPATAIRADWAAQRIKNLSLGRAVLAALRPGRSQVGGPVITSLIEQFHYPRLGPGMMWERCRELVEAAGCKVHLDRPVTRIRHEGGRAVEVETTADGAVTTYPCTHVVSSMPLADLVRVMDPPVPADVRAAADALRFRDFLTVALVVPDDAAFPDNWIYVHSPEVRVGRIQNFGAWSPDMVKPGRTCLGLEYFVFAGGDLWELPDAELVALGHPRARGARPRGGVARRGRVRRADAEGLPRLRRGLRGERRGAARLAGGARAERAPGGPQRHAPLQQPGPLDAHRDARGGEHRRARRARRLVGQRRGRLPRGESAGPGPGATPRSCPRRSSTVPQPHED